MTSFSRTWNSAYQALPTNAEQAKLGASRIRELKTDVAERMVVDHRWAGDQYDGQHLQVTMQALTADPTAPAGNAVGIIYCKLQGTVVELYFRDSNGGVTPITSALSGIVSVLPGTILPFGNAAVNTIANKGDAYVYCNGQQISRTDFSALFFAIGVIWGVGDGVSTFTVPDLRGRGLIGSGQSGSLSNRVAGQTGGAETHVLSISEIPGHQHQVLANTSSNTPGGDYSVVSPGSHNGSILTQSAGGDANGAAVAHQIMNPFGVINWMIKT